MNGTINQDIKVKDKPLNIRIETFVRKDAGNALREENTYLTSDQVKRCETENQGSEKLETGGLDTAKIPMWILVLVGGIVGGGILGIFLTVFWLKNRKRNTEDGKENVDINPDYGYDYGEIRDNNDCYFAEDYDDGDEVNTEMEELDLKPNTNVNSDNL